MPWGPRGREEGSALRAWASRCLAWLGGVSGRWELALPEAVPLPCWLDWECLTWGGVPHLGPQAALGMCGL